MTQKSEIQRLRDEAKSMNLSAAGGLKALTERIAAAKAEKPSSKSTAKKATDKPVLTADELHAKRSEAAKKAVATMRASGKLPPERVKEPVDPALSARAQAAWATRRANAEAAAKEAAK